MSLINTPEVYDLYGALDSDAFADGIPHSAHTIRAIALSTSRLASKGSPLINLFWPERESVEENDGVEGFAPRFWTRILHSVDVPKKPGLRFADFRAHARISATHTVNMQICTRARPFNPHVNIVNSENIMKMTGGGGGDVDLYTVDDVPVDPGPYESIELWIKGLPTTDAPGASGGTPTSRSGLSGRPIYYAYGLDASGLGASWTSSLAGLGTAIRFWDGSGDFLDEAYISSVPSSDMLAWRPSLIGDRIRQIDAADDWDLYQVPFISLVSFSGALVERDS